MFECITLWKYLLLCRDHLSKFRVVDKTSSMNFIVEHFAWRKLPESLLEPYGGKLAARETRKGLRGDIPQSISNRSAADVASNNDTFVEKNTLGDTSNLKRQASVSDAFDEHPLDKRPRGASEGVIEWVGESAATESKIDADFGQCNIELSTMARKKRSEVSLVDLSGRGIEPYWRRFRG
jgi:hypothetical protein